MINEDDDLSAAFSNLKADDAKLVSEFSLPSVQHSPWGLRSGGVITLAAAGAAALCVLPAIFHSDESGADAPAPSIAFDELSNVISQEFLVASASKWVAPTDFLLDPDYSSLIDNQE